MRWPIAPFRLEISRTVLSFVFLIWVRMSDLFAFLAHITRNVEETVFFFRRQLEKRYLRWFQLILVIVGGDFCLITEIIWRTKGTEILLMRPPIPQCCADQITVVDQITGGWGGCNYRPGHNSDASSHFSMPSSTVETNQNSVCSRRFSTKHVGFSPGNFFKWIPFCLL